MASLTPLSKGLIALAVVGGMASAVWHLGLKERLAGGSTPPPPAESATATREPATVPQAAPAPSPTAAATAPPAMGSNQVAKLSPAENAELGRKLLDSGNYAQARVHLEQAVKGGDGGAACHLGDMTLKGLGGITASQEKAASLFQLAQFHNIICFAASK